MCTKSRRTNKRGFHLQQGTLATVEGSRKFAERVVEDFSNNENFTVHFCSVAVKDQVQIRERYLRRADNIHLPFEEISEDGCLLFMQIQGPLSEILKLEKFLLKQAKIPEKMMKLNKTRGTLDLPPFLANEKNFWRFLKIFGLNVEFMRFFLLEIQNWQKLENIHLYLTICPAIYTINSFFLKRLLKMDLIRGNCS